MKKKVHCLQRGFTLIEMVIVLTVLGIVADITSVMILQAARMSTIQYALTNVSAQARLVSMRMVREIRMAAIITTATSNQLTFDNIHGTQTDYTLSGNTVSQNGNPIVDGVTNLTFEYFDEDGAVESTVAADICYIRFKMTITKNGHSTNVSYTVYLPNVT